MRDRTRGRELAVQFLYQMDLRGGAAETLDDFLDRHGQGAVPKDYARTLVGGVRARRPDLDAAISRVAEHWDLARMAAVDRNILRLAAWELIFAPDIPPAVAIDEAVDLAKKFSTEESGAFVNGLPDKIKDS